MCTTQWLNLLYRGKIRFLPPYSPDLKYAFPKVKSFLKANSSVYQSTNSPRTNVSMAFCTLHWNRIVLTTLGRLVISTNANVTFLPCVQCCFNLRIDLTIVTLCYSYSTLVSAPISFSLLSPTAVGCMCFVGPWFLSERDTHPMKDWFGLLWGIKHCKRFKPSLSVLHSIPLYSWCLIQWVMRFVINISAHSRYWTVE